MGLNNIRAALETRVSVMSPALATAWENDRYTPVEGTPYQRVYLLPAEPENPEMTNTVRRELGILQISLLYPLHQGPGAALARAELIRTAFPRGLSLSHGGVVVTVEKTPEIGPAQYEPDRYVLPVRIRWFSNLST